MSTVSLSSGVRSALTSLASTKADASQAQYRLATGKKVNSAVDSPVNFFTAASLNDRASQLTDLLDGISNGIQTIQAASKGIDSITNLVKSLQSTVKQAQNDAAANRPKIAGSADLGAASTAFPPSGSKLDIALNKKLIGAAPAGTLAQADDPATAGDQSTSGDLGVTAAAAGSSNAVRIQAGSTTYTFNFSSTSTVRDLVNSINGSGIATASVGSDGKLTVTGTGSDNLTLEVGSTDDTTQAFTASATATDTTNLFGTADNTDVSASGTSSVRSTLVKQFNDLRDQIDGLAKDSGFNGINLLGGDKLSITFNEKTGANKNKLDIQGQTITSANLGIGSAVDGTATTAGDYNIQNDTDLAKAADALTNVLTSLRATSSSLGSQLSVVQTRQDFTKDLVNTLTAGADNLTLADTNEEGAKLLALQTRQQLSQTALSLSNQADQAVLRLF
jgi:flagellin-like hook-associated protein FlgL